MCVCGGGGYIGGGGSQTEAQIPLQLSFRYIQYMCIAMENWQVVEFVVKFNRSNSEVHVVLGRSSFKNTSI